MAKRNSEITKQAREALSDKWPLAIGTFFIFTLVSGIGGPAALIIGGPMLVGGSIFSLNISRGKTAELPQIFDGFKIFPEALMAYLIMVLRVILWSLLLIIPGIIAALSYSQTFFILADNPEIKGSEALEKSKKMMDGYKWKYFCLNLRFFGWAILSIFTLGIGLLWLIPYMQVGYAKFYEDLSTTQAS